MNWTDEAREKIAAFKLAARRLMEALAWWRDNRANVARIAPDLVARGDRASREGNRLRNFYGYLTAKIDEVARTIRGTLDGMGVIEGGLGALPILVWGAIAAAVGLAIISFNNTAQEIYEIKRIYDERKTRVDAGDTLPVPTMRPTWIDQLGSNIVIPLAIVAGLFLFSQMGRKKASP